ncbi:MAG: hypothetical protein IK134_01050 [Oscillospiraceae bacterium]|nr:hypothetical protein [Oscillospiraceae bacterium]
MQDEPKNESKNKSQNQSNEPADMQHAEKVSAFHNAMELQAKVRREEELRERRRQANEAEAAYQAREEYAKELAEEKVELIRLKQGVIEDSDRIFQEEESEKKYTVLQKIGNWFYHSKWWLGIAAFCTIVVAFLIYDYVTRENPDLRILLLTDHIELDAESNLLCDWLENMCEDYTGDGEVLVQTVYIPVSKVNMEAGTNYTAAYNTQLLVQFQANTCMLVLVDPEAEEYLQPEDMFVELDELYPDCPYVSGRRMLLDDTDFEEQAGLTVQLHPGSYLALRIPAENMNSLEENQLAYDQAKTLLDSIVASLHTTGSAEE